MLSFVRLQWRRLALYCRNRTVQTLRLQPLKRTLRTWILVSDFRRNHWGMGLIAHISILLVLLSSQGSLLTGSGARPWRGCASCGRSSGKATHAKSSQSAFRPHIRPYGGRNRETQRHTIVLDVVRGAAAVGGKGRKIKVGGRVPCTVLTKLPNAEGMHVRFPTLMSRAPLSRDVSPVAWSDAPTRVPRLLASY